MFCRPCVCRRHGAEWISSLFYILSLVAIFLDQCCAVIYERHIIHVPLYVHVVHHHHHRQPKADKLRQVPQFRPLPALPSPHHSEQLNQNPHGVQILQPRHPQQQLSQHPQQYPQQQLSQQQLSQHPQQQLSQHPQQYPQQQLSQQQLSQHPQQLSQHPQQLSQHPQQLSQHPQQQHPQQYSQQHPQKYQQKVQNPHADAQWLHPAQLTQLSPIGHSQRVQKPSDPAQGKLKKKPRPGARQVAPRPLGAPPYRRPAAYRGPPTVRYVARHRTPPANDLSSYWYAYG
ncbi:hypothetical protein M8J76_016402 [Diaphorina citri]|nr:hypothetical protein M8J76_016402 [Diaphorina citri]